MGSLDALRAAPPPPLPKKAPTRQSSSLLRIIAVAVCLVLAFHWYLVLHHVGYHAPRDLRHRRALPGDGSQAPGGGKYRPRYVLSPVCGGCYRAQAVSENGESASCHDLIQQYTNDHAGTSLREASRRVGAAVGECGICNPETCYQRRLGGKGRRKADANANANADANARYRTKYWRFDQTAPRLTSATSLVLPSIPDRLRIPRAAYDDIEAYITAKYAHPDPEDITNVFLLEYNPGLAPIPRTMRAYLPWNARYVLSLRVTPHNFCFPTWLTERLPEDIKQTMHSLNHMGLALLDAQYRLIPGHDVVIDLDRQLHAKKASMGEPAFVDYRLFTLNDELYLNINADTVMVTKLRLRSRGMGNATGDDAEDAALRDIGETPIKLRNLYGGDQLQVTLLHQFNTIWGEEKWLMYGKNYALFTVPNVTHPATPAAIYAEMEVHPEHVVKRVHLDIHDLLPKDRRIKWRKRRNFMIDHMVQRKMRTGGNATRSRTNSAPSAALPSFSGVDEVWFPGKRNPFKEFAHGGACCVSLSVAELAWTGGVLPNSRDHPAWEGVGSVLVGVGHTLTTPYSKKKISEDQKTLMLERNYVSFFYAFAPRPPFQLLARSGYFCLGFASESEEEENGTINPRSVLTHHRQLQQNNETFACSQIHYISTIVEKVDDPSAVVIGYGMNDCTSRLVEVAKREIATLLFPDPWDMVVSTPL